MIEIHLVHTNQAKRAHAECWKSRVLNILPEQCRKTTKVHLFTTCTLIQCPLYERKKRKKVANFPLKPESALTTNCKKEREKTEWKKKKREHRYSMQGTKWIFFYISTLSKYFERDWYCVKYGDLCVRNNRDQWYDLNGERAICLN